MAFRDVHLPGSQVILYCPGRSVADFSLFLLHFKHHQNLMLVVLDRSSNLLRRKWVKLFQDGRLSRCFHVGGGVKVDVYLGNKGLSKRLFTVNGLVQNISHNFLGGLEHLHFSKKLINVFVLKSRPFGWRSALPPRSQWVPND